MVDDQDGSVAHVALFETSQRGVEDLLRNRLDVRIEGGADLRGYLRLCSGLGDGITDEVAGIERGLAGIQRKRVLVNALPLGRRQVSRLYQAICQLLDGAARARFAAPKIHPVGRAHEDRERELLRG